MHKLYELKEKLMNELEDYADNGKFSKDDVEAIKYTASAIDHICNIVEGSEDYSEAMNDGMMMRPYNRSYRRGGRRGANQYGSYGRNQYGSYAGGYSRANEDIANELREIAKDAPSDHVRQEIHSLVSRIENM